MLLVVVDNLNTFTEEMFSAPDGIQDTSSPFRGEKIERMPEKVNLFYYCFVTAGIVPYVSQVANGYTDMSFARHNYMSVYPLTHT